MTISKSQAQKLIGKQIYAVHKNGQRFTGKLVRISGNKLVLKHKKGGKVQTKALIPLVLFDLLAIGATQPYGYGGGYGYGGYGGYPYGGYGYGGYPYGGYY